MSETIPSRERKLTGKILFRPADSTAEAEAVPFIPAWDLLAAEEKKLTVEEITAVGLALLEAVPESKRDVSAWELAARLESVSQSGGKL